MSAAVCRPIPRCRGVRGCTLELGQEGPGVMQRTEPKLPNALPRAPDRPGRRVSNPPPLGDLRRDLRVAGTPRPAPLGGPRSYLDRYASLCIEVSRRRRTDQSARGLRTAHNPNIGDRRQQAGNVELLWSLTRSNRRYRPATAEGRHPVRAGEFHIPRRAGLLRIGIRPDLRPLRQRRLGSDPPDEVSDHRRHPNPERFVHRPPVTRGSSFAPYFGRPRWALCARDLGL